ncbi:MAG: glycosyltransferase family 4 protein [Patescibacteria group bacterium]
MKIGIALDDSLDRPDGVQQYVRTLGNWLEAEGHEIHFLAGETKNSNINNLHSLARTFKVRFNKNQLAVPMPTSRRTINKKLQQLDLDVVHAQMPFSPFFVGRLIQVYNGPVVATFHILPSGILSAAGNKMLAKFQKRTINLIDDVIAVSAPAANYAVDIYGVKNPKIVPNSIKINNKGTKNSSNKITEIRFLGRLVNRKGALLLLKAINLLVKNNNDINFRLTIGGSGPLDKKLKKYVKSKNLEKLVSFAGFIHEDQKATFLNLADIAIFPATGGESFGIVIIEAIDAGAGIVIGGNNPGYAYVLDDKRVLVNPNSTIELANLLKQFITDKNLRNEIQELQRNRLMNFDIDKNGPKVLKIYNSAIAKHKIK